MEKILIIEDEPVIRKQMAKIFRFEGFETLEAENGRLGAAAAIATVPNLILCDIMMPDLDGFGVLQALRNNPQTAMIPFIYVTALDASQNMRHGMDEGADDYITKPCKPETLVISVRRRLEKRNRQIQEGQLCAEKVVLEYVAQCARAENDLRLKTGFLEAQVNTLIDGILITDRHGRKILQNRQVAGLFKVPRHIAEEEDGIAAKQVDWAAARTKNPEQFAEKVAYLNAHPSEASRDEIELKDGTTLDRYTSPVIGAEGTYYGRLWMFRDITKSKQAQAERKNLELRLAEHKASEERARLALEHEQKLSQTQSRFVSMVSHEFRTPLSVISLAVKLLASYMDKMTAAERSEQLTEIQISVERMTQMMTDLLIHGNCTSGKMECKPARVEVEALCRQLITEVPSYSSLPSPIECVVDPEVDEAWLDEKILRHILGNLLSNAVKYSMDGHPVKLEVRRVAAPPQSNGGTDTPSQTLLEFKVSDSGIGIPAADLAKLCQTFHRAANVGKRPGTGMGLAIVKQFVDLHRGTIRFESKEGKGTTVWVELPAASPAAQKQS